jgi:hypothetical protein
MKRLAAMALAMALAITACAAPEGDRSTVARHAMVPDLGAGVGAPAWSGSKTSEDDATKVASVNGSPIGEAEIARLLAARPQWTARHALEALIETEVLAQTRLAGEAAQPSAVHRAWREAMAQRYVREVFEADNPASSIPLKEVQRIYWVPSVRKAYDHADAWQMAHLFFTCCDPKIETCDSPEIMACFADAGRTIQEVYAEVKSRSGAVEGDPDAVVAVMEAYRLEMENELPQLAFRKRPFYYDPSKSHDEQKGYNLLAEAVARTIAQAPLAVVQEPVQSPFGWHILVQVDHVPESRRGVDDAGVISDIRSNLLPRYRRSQFARHVKELRARYGVQMIQANLAELGGGGAVSAQAP